MTSPRGEHVAMDTLVSYFAHTLDDEQECGVEEHIADCDACAKLAQGVHAFEECWQLPATTVAEISDRALLIGALTAARSESPSIEHRLGAWAVRWAGLAEGALRVAVETTATTARVIAEGLDALARPGSGWQFAPVAAAASVRGPRDEDSSAAVLTTAPGTAHPRARVAIRGGAETEIDVRIDGLATDDSLPLVVLVEREPDGEPRVHVATLEARPTLGCHVARFSGLPAGEYVLAVEPLAARPR